MRGWSDMDDGKLRSINIGGFDFDVEESSNSIPVSGEYIEKSFSIILGGDYENDIFEKVTVNGFDYSNARKIKQLQKENEQLKADRLEMAKTIIDLINNNDPCNGGFDVEETYNEMLDIIRKESK